jgi:hypothetical protein
MHDAALRVKMAAASCFEQAEFSELAVYNNSFVKPKTERLRTPAISKQQNVIPKNRKRSKNNPKYYSKNI